MAKLTDMEDIEICPKPSMDVNDEFEEVVGFDDDVEIISEYLKRRTSTNLDVISIVGMAGIGKTALARKIYNSNSIIKHFDVRAWCSVSQIYDVRKLLLEMLKQIMCDECVTAEDDLYCMFRKRLMARRFLIVLDDIWECKAWDNLQLCVGSNYGKGSRVMVTTRNEKLAMYMRQHTDPYSLPFLNDEKSWELLQKKVFQGENCPSELSNVGPLVAKKCRGLPSLIIMIAGILSSKKKEADLWLKVAYDICSHAFEKEMSLKTIQSSYDHLANHLKPCLIYMALFPKSYEIPVSDLLEWWIAEEFVQNIDTWRLEELSEICLYDLVSRNLVMVSKTRSNGKMKCCIVLDQVREFCLRKITEEKFMQLIVPYSYPEEQRLCMYIHDRTMTSDFKGSDHKEFIVHPKFSILDRKNPFRLLNNLRLVRVLHLLDIYLDNSLSAEFQSFPHLRYLAIFVKAFDLKWLSHLLHLQTLRVRSSYIMISSAIWRMSKLRHVDINEFPITVWEEEDDIELDNLKTLGMCCMSVADMTPKFWDKFPYLEELKLHINEFGDHVSDYSNSALMNFDTILPWRLKCLSLSEMFLTHELVSSIAELQCLETLKLSEIYFAGERHWDLGDYTFEKLKFLKLHHVFMTKWSCREESFPCLEYLVIKSCPKLEEIPQAFVDIIPLQLIKVIDCSDSVGNSAVKIQKELEENYDSCSLQVHILKKDK